MCVCARVYRLHNSHRCYSLISCSTTSPCRRLDGMAYPIISNATLAALITLMSTCAMSPWSVPVAATANSPIRVLAVETIAGKSHWNFMRAVLRALTDGGHHVTVFTPFVDGDRENYTEVDMSADFPIKLDMDLAEILEKFVRPTSLLPLSVTLSRYFCDIVYGNKRMQDVLRRRWRDDFDVVIIEPMSSKCVSYLATELGLPAIYAIPSPMITHNEHGFFGHVPNPATVSHLLADHSVPRSFGQRIGNAVLSAYAVLSVKYGEWTAQPRPYDRIPAVPPALVFVNSDFITEAPRPVPPNVVYVGGLHLERPKTVAPNVRIKRQNGSPIIDRIYIYKARLH